MFYSSPRSCAKNKKMKIVTAPARAMREVRTNVWAYQSLNDRSSFPAIGQSREFSNKYCALFTRVYGAAPRSVDTVQRGRKCASSGQRFAKQAMYGAKSECPGQLRNGSLWKQSLRTPRITPSSQNAVKKIRTCCDIDVPKCARKVGHLLLCLDETKRSRPAVYGIHAMGGIFIGLYVVHDF